MKRVLALSLIGIISITLPGYTQEQETAAKANISKLLPEDPIFFARINNIGNACEQLKSWATQFINENELDQLLGFVNKLISSEVSNKIPEDLLNSIVKAGQSLSSINLGVYLSTKENAGIIPVGVFVIEATSEGPLQQLLESIISFIKETDQRTLVSTLEIDGNNVYRLEPNMAIMDDENDHPDREVYMGTYKSLAIMTNGKSAFKNIFKKLSGKDDSKSLSDNSLFQKINKTGTKNVSLDSFIDLKQLFYYLSRTEIQTDEFTRAELITGFTKVTGFTLSASLDNNNRMVTDAAIGIDKGCKIYDLIRQPPTEQKDILNLIPADSLFSTVSALDLANLWNNLEGFFENRGEVLEDHDMRQAEFGIQMVKGMVEAAVGKKLEEFLSEYLGDEIGGFIYTPSIMGFAGGEFKLPAYGLIIEFKSAEKLQEITDTLMETPMYMEEIEPNLAEKDYNGNKIHYLKNQSLQYGYCLFDKFLILGSVPGIQNAIKVYNTDKSLAKSEGFNKAMSSLPKSNSNIYAINSEKIIGLISNAYSMVKLMLKQKSRGDPDEEKLPDIKELKNPGASYEIVCTVHNENEFSWHYNGSGIFNLTIPVAAAVLIPFVMKSKSVAIEQTIIRTLFVLSEVNHMWAVQNNEYWTKDVAGLCYLEKDGKMINLISSNIADSDPQVSQWKPKARSIPLNGYHFTAVKNDEDGNPYCQNILKDGPQGEPCTNNNKFAFCAYPANYGNTARLTYIVNESGIVYKKDTGGESVTDWPADPESEGWIRFN